MTVHRQVPETTGRDVRGAGFRLLVQTRAPVSTADLARATRQAPEETTATVAALADRGSARLDDGGRLAAIAGLSVVPDRHPFTVWGWRLWTWCAYDALGILGALDADGALETVDPYSGEPVTVRFTHGEPEPAPLVLLLPAEQDGGPSYHKWCPYANLFTSDQAANEWGRTHRVDGQLLPLADAVRVASTEWQPIAPVQPFVRTAADDRTDLFSYGTLGDPAVQRASLGREPASASDVLAGYRLDVLDIGDPTVVRTSGTSRHPIAKATGDQADRIDGMVFEISSRELAVADEYEVAGYQRVQVTLGSGRSAWAYVARS